MSLNATRPDNPQMRIRPEQFADIAAIHALTAAAFQHAEHSAGTEQFIVAALREAGALNISLVAELEQRIVGHVAVSPVSIGDGSPDWFGLGPLSVLPDRQRQGIGSALLRAALQSLRERGAAGCVLLGEPAFYSRFGFRAHPGLVYPGVPEQYFLGLPLGGPLPSGQVRYHQAFDASS